MGYHMHSQGKPISPQSIKDWFDRSEADALIVWVFVRLAQQPGMVYRGLVKTIFPDGKNWMIGTRLSFHDDDTRMSVLQEGKGVDDDRDEVVGMVRCPPGLEPTASFTWDEFLIVLKSMDPR